MIFINCELNTFDINPYKTTSLTKLVLFLLLSQWY